MFSDIAQHWASACIVALAKRSLVNGYPNGTFRPKSIVTRAEFAAMMLRIFPDLPEKRTAIIFPDVLSEYWASGAIKWASERGLFSGDEKGRFLPRQSISRAQALVVLVAALEANEASEAVSVPEAESAAQRLSQLPAKTFSDAQKIPCYASAAVCTAFNRGLLVSLAESRPLSPYQAMTRGDIAGLLCRALEIPQSELVRSDADFEIPRKDLFQGFLKQEAGFDAEELAFLDRKIKRSPYRRDIAQAPVRLQFPTGIPQTLENPAPYPRRGTRPMLDGSGIDFLSPNILSGCLCLATIEEGMLKARWLGREAFTNRQMWSSTKFIPLLNLIDRANAIAPYADIDRCLVRRAGGQGGFRFNDLASGIMSYDNRISTSNQLAAMFMHFNTPGGLEKWTRELTGNRQLSFQGRYGEPPFIEFPELWDSQTNRVLVKSPGVSHSGQYLVSTFDLTRLITTAGWHWRLPRQAIIPNAQGHSVESVLRSMGVDTARYVDVALDRLGLAKQVQSPVILSKSGFGYSDQRDRTELTYCALIQFSLPRQGASDPTASHQHYAFGLTLIAAQRTGNINQEARSVDALMAAEVTEIIRRIIKGTI